VFPLSRSLGGGATDHDAGPLIRVRDLKVWFPLRRGLVRELAGRSTLWVRAVDGVSFDVKRGEVFCLVGESGCGKTTTGKALLRLVDATEGDVFFEVPETEYRRYEALRTQSDTDAAAQIDGIRRKYSFSWQEKLTWDRRQVITWLRVVTAAFILGLGLPALAASVFAGAFASAGFVLGASIVCGALTGAVGSLPPTRPARRTPTILALLSVLGFNLVPVIAGLGIPGSIPGAPTDGLGIFFAVWGSMSVAMIFGVLFAAASAGAVSKILLDRRRESEGLQGIKIRTLRRRLHLIFQDPYESLNPKQSVFEIVSEPLLVNRIAHDPEEIAALVSRSLEDAGLRPAEDFALRFPHELSGGQRQRVSIAAALALEPDFIVADEPVSMLDVSIRTEILQLMMDLREKRGLTYLFITHDLGLAWVLADRIAVMYLGKIVETGTAEQVIGHPMHPYTQALISVVPSPDPRKKVDRVILKGERPDPVNIPAGCRFHPRCPLAFERCGWTADEVVDELQSLRGRGMLPEIEAFRAESPNTIGIAIAPDASPLAVAETLRSFIRENRSSRPALKGIADVHVTDGSVLASMHAGSEPQLVELSPGNEAACHLVTQSSPTDATITA